MTNRKIAIVVPPFLGHINPTLAVGQQLIKLGYDVCWISMNPYLGEVIPDKGRFLKIPHDFMNAQHKANDESQYGMRSLQKLYEDDLVPMNKFMYTYVKEFFQKESFDAVITDHQTSVGAVLAYEFDIPFVTSATAPAAVDASDNFPEVINYERSQIIAMQRDLGVDLSYSLVCGSGLTLVYTTVEFIGHHDFPDSYQFVGPSLNKANRNAVYKESEIKQEVESMDKSRPTVLVTIGSILNSDASFVDKVIKAFSNQAVNVILVADPWSRTDTGWPSNFHVFEFIPQLWVLERVQAVICHGGHNTVCEALSMEIPVLTIPMMNDQSYVASRVTLSGSGLRLKYRRFTAEHLRNATTELLTEPKYKVAASKIKASFIRAGGELRAAALVDAFIVKHYADRILTPEALITT